MRGWRLAGVAVSGNSTASSSGCGRVTDAPAGLQSATQSVWGQRMTCWATRFATRAFPDCCRDPWPPPSTGPSTGVRPAKLRSLADMFRYQPLELSPKTSIRSRTDGRCAAQRNFHGRSEAGVPTATEHDHGCPGDLSTSNNSGKEGAEPKGVVTVPKPCGLSRWCSTGSPGSAIHSAVLA